MTYRTPRCPHGMAPRLCVIESCAAYDGVRTIRDVTKARGRKHRSGTLQCLACKRRVPRELLSPTRRCGCESVLALSAEERIRIGGVK